MSDQGDLNLGLSNIAAAPSGAPAAPAPPPAPAPAADPRQTAANPRTENHSPAADARRAAASPDAANASIEIDGVPHQLESLRETIARDAAEQSRRLSLPQSAEAYAVELPADFQGPEGVKFEFDMSDPLIANAKAMAHAKGWSQADFTDALGLYAANEARQMGQLQAAKTAEIAKLGVAGPARVDAVCNWLKAIGGQDAATLVRVLDYAPVAGTVQAFERMMRKFSTQGGSDFSQQHRTAPEAGKIEGYAKMTFAQRREAQDRVNGRR